VIDDVAYSASWVKRKKRFREEEGGETEATVGYVKRRRRIKTRWFLGGLTWTHEKVQGRAGCCWGKEGEAIRKHSRVPKSLPSSSSSSSLSKSNHHLHLDFLLLFYYFFGELRLLEELIFTVEINVIIFFVNNIIDTVIWLLINWIGLHSILIFFYSKFDTFQKFQNWIILKL